MMYYDDEPKKRKKKKKPKDGLTRGEKALIKRIRKSKGVSRKGVVGAFGLQRGRIRY